MLGTVPPLILAVVVMYAGTGLFWSGLDGKEAWGIVLWALIAAGFLICGVYMYLLYETFQGIRSALPLMPLTNSAAGGIVIGLLIGYYDYGRRRKAVSFAQEKERLNALFQNIGAPAAMLEFQEDDLIIERINSMFEDTFSIPPDEIIDHPVTKLPTPSSEETLKDIEREVRGQQTCANEVEYTTPDWTLYFVVQVAPFTIEETEGAFLIYIDITDNKRSDKIKQQRLSVLNRILRHDLRNKVNVIMGKAEILRNRLPDEEASGVSDIVEKTEELVRISDRVLMLEKSQEETYPVDIVEIMEKQLEEFASKNQEVSIKTDLSDELWVKGSLLLNLIFELLLENTVEHTDLTKDEVEISVEATKEAHGYAAVRIRDNGPGIPEKVLRVLESDEESSLHHNEGVSLWIVKWILNVMGGELDFERNKPRGTEAIVKLKTDLDFVE